MRYLAMICVAFTVVAVVLRRLALAYVPAAPAVRPADVVVVLGHPANRDGSPSLAMQEQVGLAAALYQAGLAPALLFTGGAVHNQHIEAQVMAGLAVQQGIPAAAIVTETQARDTFENVRYCRQIMQAHGWQDAIVVTTPYHVRRASRIFRLAGITHQMAYPAQSYQCASWRERCRALWWDLQGQAWLAASQWFGLDPSRWAKRRTERTVRDTAAQ